MRRAIHRSLSFTLAAGLLTPMVASANSVELDAHCDVESHYGLQIDTDRLGFTRKSSSTTGPARIEIVGSSIHVDGRAITLSASDHAAGRREFLLRLCAARGMCRRRHIAGAGLGALNR